MVLRDPVAAADSDRRALLVHQDRVEVQGSAEAEDAAATALEVDRAADAVGTAAEDHPVEASADAHNAQWVRAQVVRADQGDSEDAAIRVMPDPSRPKRRSS
jgi:hypothetical protein